MGDSLLRLPATVRLANAGALWRDWQRSLQAEANALTAQAARELHINAGELLDFDSSVLSLLLSGARLCTEHGLQLRVQNAPAKLVELAGLYGVQDLLWSSDRAAAG
jgi:phospholipid transport system transporter-binding protein